MSINIEQELDEANARLPIVLPDQPLPLDMQMRTIALTVAQRHVGDTVVREGNLYQQLKMDDKLGGVVTETDVVRCALVFERYLWGEWSKGIAANALEATMTDAADAIEEQFRKKRDEASGDEPTRPSSGGNPSS